MRIVLLAAAAALVSASFAHAADPFNPQPDPPGRHAAQDSFNPQPDPPGRHDVARDKICHDARGAVVKCAAPPPCHDAQGRTLACAHKPG